MSVLNKNKQAHLIITRDRVLFEGVSGLSGAKRCVHIRQKQDICQHQHRNAVLVIDTLQNNIFHGPLADGLESLQPSRVIILSPFGIRRLFPESRRVFMPRDAGVAEFCRILSGGKEYRQPAVYFTKKQHQIVSLFLRLNHVRHIAEETGITQKTLASHQYNIMLLLNLKQFSRVHTHPFADYLRYVDDSQTDE
ncbi:hypothetical protein GW742_24875 [Citrobacter freundii]|nr:hypothetical protein [Citrobacter freundii]MBC6509513.1 hypothetical protein [Citrobacter freundii]